MVFSNESPSVTTGLFLHAPDDESAGTVIVCSAFCASSQTPCVGFMLNGKLEQCRLITYWPESGADYDTIASSSADDVKSYFLSIDRFLAQSKLCIPIE